MGVLGHPAKYTCCIAENEAESPWPSQAVELGFGSTQDTVTVLPALFMRYFSTVGGRDAGDVLQPLCETLGSAHTASSVTRETETFVVLNPAQARMLNDLGMGKGEVARYIHRNTRIPSRTCHRMARVALWDYPTDHKNTFSSWPDATIAMHNPAENIRVAVGGAEGAQSVFFRLFLGGMVTGEIVSKKAPRHHGGRV